MKQPDRCPRTRHRASSSRCGRRAPHSARPRFSRQHTPRPRARSTHRIAGETLTPVGKFVKRKAHSDLTAPAPLAPGGSAMATKLWKLSAAIAMTALLAESVPAQTSGPIKIGASLSLTGTYAKPGTYQKEG